MADTEVSRSSCSVHFAFEGDCQAEMVALTARQKDTLLVRAEDWMTTSKDPERTIAGKMLTVTEPSQEIHCHARCTKRFCNSGSISREMQGKLCVPSVTKAVYSQCSYDKKQYIGYLLWSVLPLSVLVVNQSQWGGGGVYPPSCQVAGSGSWHFSHCGCHAMMP